MIYGVNVVPLVTREDDRGYLTEIARINTDMEPHAIVHEFGQVYIVGDPVKGTIRAFHKHFEMWDWYFIAQGSAKIVLFDDREQSPTYAKTMTIIASMLNPKLIAIPPGVFHGWMSLEDDTILVSMTSAPYNREKPDQVRVPHDNFGDVWTVKMR